MRVALISDIHGNCVALETVLADIEGAAVDQVVCLGDVAATGPQPRAVIERLQATGCPVVMGNADAWLLNPQLSETEDEATHQIEEIDLWCAAQLSENDLAYIRAFQPTVGVSLDHSTKLLCFHGSPRSNTEVIEATTPEDALAEMFSGYSALVMVGGHTHVQLLRRYGEAFVLNPGSVGLPFERKRLSEDVYNPPWAEYALVGWESASLSIQLKRVPLDITAVTRAALESGMPHAEVWVKDWRRE
jgi:predicted phosphodiesterase